MSGTVTFLLLLGYVVGWLLFGQQWPRGFATTTILLLFSMTLNAMFMGIVGEYVGRIFMQSKRRPATIVEETLNAEQRCLRRADAAGAEGEIVPRLPARISLLDHSTRTLLRFATVGAITTALDVPLFAGLTAAGRTGGARQRLFLLLRYRGELPSSTAHGPSASTEAVSRH